MTNQRILDQQGNAVAVVDWSAFDDATRPAAAQRWKRLLGTGAVLASSVAVISLVAWAYQGSSVERHVAQAGAQTPAAEAPAPHFGLTPGEAGAQGAPQAPSGLSVAALPQGSRQAPTIDMPGAPQAPPMAGIADVTPAGPVSPAGMATAPQDSAQAPVAGMPGEGGTDGAPVTAQAADASQPMPLGPGTAINIPQGGGPAAPQTAPSVPGAAVAGVAPQTRSSGAQAQAGTAAPADQQTQAAAQRVLHDAAANAAPQGEAVSEVPGATPGEAQRPIALIDVVRFITVDLGEDLRVVSGWRYASATDAAPTNSWCTVRLPLASGSLASTHIQLGTQQVGSDVVTLPWSAGSMPGLTERDHQRAVAFCTWFQPG
jgi:hypothetical protein